jgi:hypothetical protein
MYIDALDGNLKSKQNHDRSSYFENLKISEFLKLIYLIDFKCFLTIESIYKLLAVEDLNKSAINSNFLLDCCLYNKAKSTEEPQRPDYLFHYENNDDCSSYKYSLNPQIKDKFLVNSNTNEQTVMNSEFALNEILRESSLVCCIYDDIPLTMHNDGSTSSLAYINEFFALNLNNSLKNMNFVDSNFQASIRNSIIFRLNEIVALKKTDNSIVHTIVDSLNSTDCMFNSFFSFDSNSSLYVPDRKFFIFSYCFINKSEDNNGKLVIFLLNCMPSVIKESLINNSSDIYVFNKFLFRLNSNDADSVDESVGNNDDNDDHDLTIAENNTTTNETHEKPTNKFSYLSKLIKSLTINLNCIYSSYIDFIEKLCATSYLNSILMYLGRFCWKYLSNERDSDQDDPDQNGSNPFEHGSVLLNPVLLAN